MTRKPWFWFLAGWLASSVFSPSHVTAMFGKKSA
jgi:hypothetical protein